MNKTYKGWELLKAIADGEIRNGAKIYFKQENEYCYYNGNSIIYELGESSVVNSHSDKYFADGDFELISEPTEEIDIQSIKNVDTIYTRESNGANEILKFHTETREIINTLIQAIKQLDNRIKEQINE